MGCDKEIDYISHPYSFRWDLIRELIIFPLLKPIARHDNEKYNLFSYKNPSQGITMKNIINSLFKTHRKALRREI